MKRNTYRARNLQLSKLKKNRVTVNLVTETGIVAAKHTSASRNQKVVKMIAEF